MNQAQIGQVRDLTRKMKVNMNSLESVQMVLYPRNCEPIGEHRHARAVGAGTRWNGSNRLEMISDGFGAGKEGRHWPHTFSQ
jgi:hypothetical protein